MPLISPNVKERSDTVLRVLIGISEGVRHTKVSDQQMEEIRTIKKGNAARGDEQGKAVFKSGRVLGCEMIVDYDPSWLICQEIPAYWYTELAKRRVA